MILSSVLVEFALIGALAGLLAASARRSVALGWRMRWTLNYRFDAGLWVLGVVASLLVVGAAGLLSTRSMVRRAAALGALLNAPTGQRTTRVSWPRPARPARRARSGPRW